MIKYIKSKDFPPYAFVPGFYPHPKLHPEGHLYNREDKIYKPLISHKYRDSEEYLWGVDLFNHGYYWEAHEEWEGLWNALNKEGITADFLKALIKLAASGVKVRQQQSGGVETHAKTANNIFRNIKLQFGEDVFAGLSLAFLISFTEEIALNSSKYYSDSENNKVEVVFDKFLLLQ